MSGFDKACNVPCCTEKLVHEWLIGTVKISILDKVWSMEAQLHVSQDLKEQLLASLFQIPQHTSGSLVKSKPDVHSCDGTDTI